MPGNSDTPRPTTSAADLAARNAEANQVIAASHARAALLMAKTTDAIINLPFQWLRTQLGHHYPTQFRQIAPRNPSGCWFQSLDDRHRLQYQQKNWERKALGEVPGINLALWPNATYIGCQPRSVSLYSTLTYNPSH